MRASTEESHIAIADLQKNALMFLEEKDALEEVISRLQVLDNRHPKHPLRLLPLSLTTAAYGGVKGSYTCGGCLKPGKGWVWECTNDGCDFHLHPHCPNTGVVAKWVEGNTFW